jgi:ATP dependent DNA ligase domain
LRERQPSNSPSCDFAHGQQMLATKSFSFEAMLCQSAERPPGGLEWRYEPKLDGFRAIGRKSGRSAQPWSRNQKDFARRFPDVVMGIGELPSNTVIDGEIVALDETGKPSFNLLQGFGARASAIVLYAFDLLMWQGKDVRQMENREEPTFFASFDRRRPRVDARGLRDAQLNQRCAQHLPNRRLSNVSPMRTDWA